MAPEDSPDVQQEGKEQEQEHEIRQRVERASVTQEAQEEEEEKGYFDAQRDSIKPSNTTEEEKAPTKERRSFPPAIAQPLRTQTTPATVQRRKTSRFGGLNRTPTGAQANPNPRDPYQYTFDPQSESDLSSSDDDGSTLVNEGIREDARDFGQRQKAKSDVGADTENEKVNTEDGKNGQSYSRFAVGNDFFKTKGRVSKRDGRLKISINEAANSGYVAKALGQSIRNHLNVPHSHKHGRRPSRMPKEEGQVDEDAESIASSLDKGIPRPRLNIVIMVIGSRGDIQPFLQVGKILKHKHGHRVRIASHPTFRDFVEKDAGLEFFSVGGDPSELMAFMVKNPGLIPNLQTVRDGEIQRRRSAMATMFDGFWRACVHTTDDAKDALNLRMMGDKTPFIVDAIIANPPSMAHVHIAEKLGVPLHVMFTFPYTPTTQFPHPLANIKARKSNVDAAYTNFMSYPLVEMMTWQGLGDIVNKFRENTLGLEPVSSLWAPGALYRMRVPYTYLWSPSLVPKPEDWGPEIDLAGFVFLDLASDFKPPQDLVDFLDAGEAPIYIGFGSIVVDDPDKFTDLIFKAAELAGVRMLVNKGWGGLGQDNSNVPEHVFMLENTPHDWLFPRVQAVVHHGGAGTTAIGLKLGKPTMIIPFFGDQPFWGARVAEAKAGAHECISYKKLTAERLAEGIKQCLTDEARQNVQKIAESIAAEGDGAENAVKSFHRSLPLTGKGSMRCSILQDRVAVWTVKKSTLRLCALAAEILQRKDKIEWKDLKLLRHYEWNDFDGPGGPFTGGAGALSSSLYEVGAGFGMVPMRIAKHLRERGELEKKKRERRQRREERQRRKAEQAASKIDGDAARATTNGDTSATTERPTNARQETTTTNASFALSTPGGEYPDALPKQILSDFGAGVKRTGVALATLPNDFSLAIAQGFHNAPRLYGDATVRKPVRIKGIKSGCVAARQEFTYGVSDAWTGLVMQPKGDWEDGETLPAKFAGLGTGIGKGLGGFVLKNVSSVVSPAAFVGQGVIKSLENWAHGPGTKGYIRHAHQIQGRNGVVALQLEQPSDPAHPALRDAETRVLEGWQVYEDLWAEARKLTVGLTGKMRLRREKRHWDENGALENVDTAARALKAVREGQDLDVLFRRHREVVRKKERPRASAMARPEADLEDDVDGDAGKEYKGIGEPEGKRSEDTVVGGGDDGAQADGGGGGQKAAAGVNGVGSQRPEQVRTTTV